MLEGMNFGGETSFVTSRRRCEDNIKLDLEAGFENWRWMFLTQDRVHREALVLAGSIKGTEFFD
jgi:hypothetical protein